MHVSIIIFEISKNEQAYTGARKEEVKFFIDMIKHNQATITKHYPQ
jgi:hypothetical protein